MYVLPMVKFCTAFTNAFKNYSNFSGRIRRSEYWFFLLVVNLVTFFLLLFFMLSISGVIRSSNPYYDYYDYRNYYRYNDDAISAFMILLVIYIAFIMTPTLSATVRRLHDIGKSGEYIFVGLVPFFGGLTLLVYLCRDSMTEANEFGPSPKYTPFITNSNSNLQTQNQSYSAPLLPNEKNSINDESSDNNIISNNNINNINIATNNNIIAPNKNIIQPNNNIIAPNNQYVAPNNNIIAPNKNIIMPNNNINVVPNNNINVVPNNNINAPNNNTNSSNSKPVQMNILADNKEEKKE